MTPNLQSLAAIPKGVASFILAGLKNKSGPTHRHQQRTRNSLPTVSVALFGTASTGKTTYVQSVCSENNLEDYEWLRFEPSEPVSVDYVRNLQARYDRGQWPEPNEEEARLPFQVRYRRKKNARQDIYGITLLDPPGEWLGFREVSKKNTQAGTQSQSTDIRADEGSGVFIPDAQEDSQDVRASVQEFINESDFVLFFAEPSTFLSEFAHSYINENISKLYEWRDQFQKDWAQIEAKLLDDNLSQEGKLKAYLTMGGLGQGIATDGGPFSKAAEVIMGLPTTGTRYNPETLEDTPVTQADSIELLRLLYIDQFLLEEVDGVAKFMLEVLYRNPVAEQRAIPLTELKVQGLPFYQVGKFLHIFDYLGEKDREVAVPLLVTALSNSTDSLSAASGALAQMIGSHIDRDGNLKKQIPVAIVVPKCDLVPGLKDKESDKYAYLIPEELRHLRYDSDIGELERSLIAHWTGEGWKEADEVISGLFYSYRGMITNLADSRIDYQVFFVSAVGSVRWDDASQKYLPPVGGPKPRWVRKPFLWYSERVSTARKVSVATRRWSYLAAVGVLVCVTGWFANRQAENFSQLSEMEPHSTAVLQSTSMPPPGFRAGVSAWQHTAKISAVADRIETYTRRYKIDDGKPINDSHRTLLQQARSELREIKTELQQLGNSTIDSKSGSSDQEKPISSSTRWSIARLTDVVAVESAYLDIVEARMEIKGNPSADVEASPAYVKFKSENLNNTVKNAEIEKSGNRVISVGGNMLPTEVQHMDKYKKIVEDETKISSAGQALDKLLKDGINFEVAVKPNIPELNSICKLYVRSQGRGVTAAKVAEGRRFTWRSTQMLNLISECETGETYKECDEVTDIDVMKRQFKTFCTRDDGRKEQVTWGTAEMEDSIKDIIKEALNEL